MTATRSLKAAATTASAALRPAARIAGLAGTKARRQGRAAIADALVRRGRLKILLFIFALAHGETPSLALAPPRAADTASKLSPVATTN